MYFLDHVTVYGLRVFFEIQGVLFRETGEIYDFIFKHVCKAFESGRKVFESGYKFRLLFQCSVDVVVSLGVKKETTQ
jgi:hypothetical protein